MLANESAVCLIELLSNFNESIDCPLMPIWNMSTPNCAVAMADSDPDWPKVTNLFEMKG
jgi:hypothetical protein